MPLKMGTPSEENNPYYQLQIQGDSVEVAIWIGDDGGHLVQKADGVLSTNLRAGRYIVEFGLGTQCYRIDLNQDLQLTQNEVEAGPRCERPTINIDNP